ncbi:uncharacterized protein LOC111705638 isoform X2 [Eurytemora carolleeae]|uniref:uncharacterized protein LOC111705638 isoform X2 n=1 Tax=Eurytemora carolleeae TaxID=1294199 RepID=UPI000C75762A|nr:uncharacterized protein LOC111705638 isoform X2 [Eurytemora carolleeae]|eukprot:XP_023334023.1 uncharacterized protein LOC111705638 isoform X2 [Eurytemora affinis]
MRKQTIMDAKERRFSWLGRLEVCKDCSHVARDMGGHLLHFREARHVNWIRSQAYREPKKRALWLKIWYSTIQQLELENPWALAFDESEEDDELELELNREILV